MSEWVPGPSPVIRYASDGCIFADGPFPQVLEFSNAVLELSEDEFLRVDGDLIDVRLSNGRWVYRIVERRWDADSVVAVLKYSEET